MCFLWKGAFLQTNVWNGASQPMLGLGCCIGSHRVAYVHCTTAATGSFESVHMVEKDGHYNCIICISCTGACWQLSFALRALCKNLVGHKNYQCILDPYKALQLQGKHTVAAPCMVDMCNCHSMQHAAHAYY